MKRIAWVSLLLAGISVSLAAPVGCQRVPTTGQRAFILLSWDQEVALGREAGPDLEKEFGGPLQNLSIQAYVRTVGQRVAASAKHPGLPELPYQFTVLDSDVVNAFALPGGPVYVTRGLLGDLATEGQLAAVLGHELVHVHSRHGSRQISRQMGVQILLAAASAAMSRNEQGARLAAQTEDLAKVVASLVQMKYGRDMESEADRFGLDYLAAAGYDPQEMVNLLNVFVSMRGARPPEFLSTHPNPENRVGAVEEIIRTKYPNRGGRVADDEYRREVLNRLKAGP
ncbi:MAG: M48 family metallopeptidase [Phycisphaerae bacterium]|nr:M48 family metallopeptidase [Phycisphaerae bacterium]